MTLLHAAVLSALALTAHLGAPEGPTPVDGVPFDIEARVTAHDDDEEPIEVDFTTLMDFEFERGKEIPKKIRQYDGKEIRITGYMDTYTQENSRQFYLMSASCGCDGEVELNHFVDVRLTDQIVGYDPSKLDVVGTFRIEEVEEEGFLVSIFQVEGRIE